MKKKKSVLGISAIIVLTFIIALFLCALKYINAINTKVKAPDTMINLMLKNGNTIDELSGLNCSQLITVSSNGSKA